MAVTIDGTANTITATSTTSFGVGQTWQNVTRASATNYTNSTGKTIFVSVTWNQTSGGGFTVDGITWTMTAYGQYGSCHFAVPNGSVYSVSCPYNGAGSWKELR